MPSCQSGDQFSAAGESNPFGQGLPAHDVGAASFPHQPIDLSSARCGAATRVIRVKQSQRTRVRLQPLDRNGALIQHPSYDEASERSESEASDVFDDFTFRLIVDHYHGAGRHVIDLEGTVVDPEFTVVEFALEPTDLRYAGLFVAQLLIQPTGEPDTVLHATPYWFEVAATSLLASNGPPTIAELRMLLRDECPTEEGLIGDFEFKDHEIAYYIKYPIDQFNASRPPVTHYTVNTFPRSYRFFWVKATLGYLLRAAAQERTRESLNYDAGGVSVQDKGNFEHYMKYAKQLIDEWELFLVETKSRMNVARGWGSLGSDYARSPVIP